MSSKYKNKPHIQIEPNKKMTLQRTKVSKIASRRSDPQRTKNIRSMAKCQAKKE